MTAFLTIYLLEAHPQLHQIFSSLIHASCPGIYVRDVGSSSSCVCDALLWASSLPSHNLVPLRNPVEATLRMVVIHHLLIRFLQLGGTPVG
jgi:hypothetical protein